MSNPTKPPENFWDERYADSAFVYGTAPNDFLRDSIEKLPAGRALALAAGEGRNAVWLAGEGYEVTAVDGSAKGLAKAKTLASEQGLELMTICADLAEFEIQAGYYQVITSIWCHLPPPLRRDVHRRVVDGLAPGGMFVLEAYRPKQLEYKTGGPPVAAMMMTADGLRDELQGLVFEHIVELDREIEEGRGHSGKSAVVQVLGRKPE